MGKNEDVKFKSFFLKIPHSLLLFDHHGPKPFLSTALPFCSQNLALTLSGTRDSLKRLISSLKTHKKFEHFHSKWPLLCSASLALTRADEFTQSALESGSMQKGQVASRHGREAEERVLISEVLVRNKDGEELERKDLEMEAVAALKASRPNSALTVLEVEANQEFQGLVCEGANVLPSKFLEGALCDGHGVWFALREERCGDSFNNGSYGDVSIIPQPAGDTGKVDLVMNVVERVSGGFSTGGGISCGVLASGRIGKTILLKLKAYLGDR